MALFPRLKTTLDNSIPLKTDDDITCAVEHFNASCCTTGRLECNADQQQLSYRIFTGNQRKNSREKKAPQAMAD